MPQNLRLTSNCSFNLMLFSDSCDLGWSLNCLRPKEKLSNWIRIRYLPSLETAADSRGRLFHQSSSWGIFRAWSQRSADRKPRHWIRPDGINSGKHLQQAAASKKSALRPYLSFCCTIYLWHYPSRERRIQWFRLRGAQQWFHTVGEGKELFSWERSWALSFLESCRKRPLTANFKLAVTLESSVASERSMASPLRGFILM